MRCLIVILTLALGVPSVAQSPEKSKGGGKSAPASQGQMEPPPLESDLEKVKKVADKFMMGAQASITPEGKALLSETAIPKIQYPILIDQKMIMENLFESDILGVHGFKRLLQVKIQSKAGTELSKQYILIAYKRIDSGEWKVWQFAEANDAEKSMLFFKGILDRKDYKYTNRSIELMHFGYWATMAGKLNAAKSAYDEYLETSKIDSLKPITKSDYGDVVECFNIIFPIKKQ